MIKITPDEFALFASQLRALTGIVLDASAGYLLENRLGPLLEELKCATFTELYLRIQADPSRALSRRMIDCVVTSETFFFRDGAPFDLVAQKLLPDLVERRKGPALNQRIPLRIWSAACSTGQEAYTLAMILREALVDLSRYDLSILGTDISEGALARAAAGSYSQIEVSRGLPPEKLARHFTGGPERWIFKEELRRLASFRPLNLVGDLAGQGLGRFDLILCRNVAIYFGEAEKTRLFNQLSTCLAPDGYLLVGVTESLHGLTDRYVSRHWKGTTYYQLKGAPA